MNRGVGILLACWTAATIIMLAGIHGAISYLDNDLREMELGLRSINQALENIDSTLRTDPPWISKIRPSGFTLSQGESATVHTDSSGTVTVTPGK